MITHTTATLGDELMAERLALMHPMCSAKSPSAACETGPRSSPLPASCPDRRSPNPPRFSTFISSAALAGPGVGYVDAHLIASTVLTSNASLWTRDNRLADIADRLDIDVTPA